MRTLNVCVVMIATVLIASSTWAEALYRCPDGTFTNKLERQCPPYEPKGIVHVQGRTAAQGDEEKPPVAEVKLLNEPAPNTRKGTVALP